MSACPLYLMNKCVMHGCKESHPALTAEERRYIDWKCGAALRAFDHNRSFLMRIEAGGDRLAVMLRRAEAELHDNLVGLLNE